MEDNSLCDSNSCDSANCPHCEDVMERSVKDEKVDANMHASWKAILQHDMALKSDQTKQNAINNDWADTLSLSATNTSELNFEKLEKNFNSKCYIGRNSVNKRDCGVPDDDRKSCGRQSTHGSEDTITAVDEEKSSSGYTGEMESSNGSCQSLNEVR